MSTFFILLFLLSLVVLLVGLFKPTLLKQESRKKVLMGLGPIAVILLIIGVVLSPNKPETPTPTVPSEESGVQEAQTNSAPTTTPTPTPKSVAKTPTPAPIPAPMPVPQTNSQTTSPTSNETVSQKSAVRAAQSYLNYTAFSHDGLVAQLEYDQFSSADAVYGADNSGANWNEQAAKAAKQYMSYSAFSRGSLIAQLEYDKYTQAQAEYGVNAVGL